MSELNGLEVERKRGDTAPDRLIVLDPATGLAMNITGFSYKLTVNSEKKPTTITNQKASLTGTLVDVLNGIVEFPWTALEADIPPGKYYYDIQQTDSSGRIKTIAKNKYTFWQDITK